LQKELLLNLSSGLDAKEFKISSLSEYKKFQESLTAEQKLLLRPILEQYNIIFAQLDILIQEYKNINLQATNIGTQLWRNNKLTPVAAEWLQEQVNLLKESPSARLDSNQIEEAFQHEFGYTLDRGFFNDIKTNQDLMIFYEKLLQKYQQKSWLSGVAESWSRAFDSMTTQSKSTAASHTLQAVGTSALAIPMGAVEVYNTLSSMVDNFFITQISEDFVEGHVYKGIKMGIQGLLLTAATSITAINSSSMSDDQKKKARQEIVAALLQDSVDYATTSQFGVSSDVLQTGDIGYITTTAGLHQMVNVLQNDNHFASMPVIQPSSANLDVIKSKYAPYLQDYNNFRSP